MSFPEKSTSLSLLERVRGQDQEAWQRLIHLYGPLVARWCNHKCARPQDAEDVQQEVFQAVATSLHKFRLDRPGDTFRGWLRGITKNKLIDHHRRRHGQPDAQGGSDAQQGLLEIAQQDLPEDSAADLGALYCRALELVRGEFEDRTWNAFWRVTIDGHDPASVASDLGVTSAAVRKAKSRILHRLREEIGDLLV
jgi:RNA polymerase sigma-70 factor (ECF subfamily)